MHGPDPDGGPPLKRLLRILLAVLLVVVDLLLLLYLLRRPLLEAKLRSLAATELGGVLGAEVEIGSIGGNWIDSIFVDGVQVRGRPGDLLRQVQDLRVEVSLAPWQLLGGDLGGLRAARIHAARVAIDPAGRPPGNGGPPSTAPSTFELSSLDGLLPGGLQLRVDEFDYGNGTDGRQGPLQLRLDAGSGRRRIGIRHDGLRAEVGVRPQRDAKPDFDGWLRVRDPAQLLACLGGGTTTAEVRGGEGYVTADVTLAPLRLAGMVAFSGVAGSRASIADSSLWVQLDQQHLQVDAGRIDLHGVHLSTGGFTMPSPLNGSAPALAAMNGSVDLQIDDLSPYRDLLPEAVAAQLPLRGRIRAWTEGGLLHLGTCKLTSPGLVLDIARGQLPLESIGTADYRDLSLDFAVQLPQPHDFAIAGFDFTTSGRIAGTLGGSLLAPQLRATLELGPSRAAGHAAASLAAAVTLADGKLQLHELRGTGLRPDGQDGASVLQGDVELVLPTADAPLRLSADVSGRADPGWLTAFGADASLATRLQPVPFAVRGAMTLPAATPMIAAATVRLDGVVLDSLPPAVLEAEVALLPAALRIDRLDVTTPAKLTAHGVLPLAAGGDVDLELTAPEQDLAFWTALAGLGAVDGTASLRLSAGGTMQAPMLALTLDSTFRPPPAWLQDWPAAALGAAPTSPLQLHLQARSDDAGIAIEALQLGSDGEAASGLQLHGHGVVPFRLRPATGLEPLAAQAPFELTLRAHGPGPSGLELPWQLAAGLHIGGDRAELDRLRLDAGPGSLSGTATVAAGFAQLLQPSTSWQDVAIAGSWQLADLRLEQVPAALLGLAVTQGQVSGNVELGGSIGAPQPRFSLQVADAQLRVPGAPRLTGLSARLSGDPHRIAVDDLKAQMGAAPIALTAVLRSPDPHWADAAQISVQAHLTGDQALVINSPQLKLRGNVDLDLEGTLAKMLLSGTIGVTTGRFAQRITALPGLDTLRGRGGAGTGEGIVLHLLEPPFGERIGLDIKLTTVRDFQVRTHTLDTDVRADLRLLGNAAIATLRGTVAASSGTLRLPGTTMSIRSLLLSFEERNPYFPSVQFLAEGRRHGYRVQLQVTGSSQTPQVVLTSTPALPAQDLLVLVTTGVLPERLANQDARAQASLVGAYLAEELASWYFAGDTTEEADQGFFDRFTVEAGREISDKGLETILIEFRLTDHLSLQAERDVYEDYNGGIGIRFRF